MAASARWRSGAVEVMGAAARGEVEFDRGAESKSPNPSSSSVASVVSGVAFADKEAAVPVSGAGADASAVLEDEDEVKSAKLSSAAVDGASVVAGEASGGSAAVSEPSATTEADVAAVVVASRVAAPKSPHWSSWAGAAEGTG